MALVDKNAAVYVKDSEAEEKLIDTAIELANDTTKLNALSENIKELAFHNSAAIIAEEVFKLADKYKKEHGR